MRTRGTTRTLDDEIERGKAHFDEVIAQEAELRAAELEQTLALARSQALSVLADEERRITEERRRDVAEREREATTKLGAALTDAQRSVEQRFADWGSDLTALQQSLTGELERIGQRQQQLVAALEAKIDAETERLEGSLDEHRSRVAKMRADLERATQEVAAAVAAELETHPPSAGAPCRRSPSGSAGASGSCRSRSTTSRPRRPSASRSSSTTSSAASSSR